MGAPSLQDGIDKAGSPVRLLWRQNPEPWNPENIEPEYAGWRAEQAAWHDGVSLSDVLAPHVRHVHRGAGRHQAAQRGLREQLRERSRSARPSSSSR